MTRSPKTNRQQQHLSPEHKSVYVWLRNWISFFGVGIIIAIIYSTGEIVSTVRHNTHRITYLNDTTVQIRRDFTEYVLKEAGIVQNSTEVAIELK